MYNISAEVFAEKPQMDIHNFVGTFTMVSCSQPFVVYGFMRTFNRKILIARNSFRFIMRNFFDIYDNNFIFCFILVTSYNCFYKPLLNTVQCVLSNISLYALYKL